MSEPWEGRPIRFAVRSDLTPSGEAATAWLWISDDSIASVVEDATGTARRDVGQLALVDVSKVRGFGTVGSAFFQAFVGDVYVDLVR